MRTLLVPLLALVAASAVAGCVTRPADPSGSPRAGCEVTGGHWRSASQTCDKD